MRRNFWIFSIVLLFCLGFARQNVQAQSGDSQYFPDSGHYVNGDFLSFYNANRNARLVYGLPITEAYIDAKTGLLIQYFENVRFEHHPNNLAGNKVIITPAGNQLYEPGEIIKSVSAATPNCHMQSNWSYPVCFTFYEFYLENGGQAHFGNPVSGLEYQEGRLVQNFEKGKLVWKPENIEGAKVTIAPLGMELFYFNKEDPQKISPIKNLEYSLNISEIHARVFSDHAIIPNGSKQTLNIIVVDQNKAPLTGGVIEVTAHYPDGRVVTSNHLATDEFGLAQTTFEAKSDVLGVVKIVIKVTYNDLETITVTSFRIWF